MLRKDIKSVLVDRYGDNNIELQFTSDTDFTIIILYPEIKITNNLRETHIIKDLYVSIQKCNRIYNFSGIRGSVSKGEYGTGYLHSHLQVKRFSYFSEFCLGSSELRGLLGEDFTKDKETFEYFLTVLDSYLHWESIEGTPYIRLKNISEYKSMNSAWDLHKINEIPIKPSSLKVNLNFIVKNVEELKKQALEYAISNNLESWIVYKIGDNYFSKEKHQLPTELPYLFEFKKKPITLKLIDNEENQKSGEQTIHPTVIKILCERISREILNFYYREYRPKTNISFGNNSRSLESNQVSM